MIGQVHGAVIFDVSDDPDSTKNSEQLRSYRHITQL